MRAAFLVVGFCLLVASVAAASLQSEAQVNVVYNRTMSYYDHSLNRTMTPQVVTSNGNGVIYLMCCSTPVFSWLQTVAPALNVTAVSALTGKFLWTYTQTIGTSLEIANVGCIPSGASDAAFVMSVDYQNANSGNWTSTSVAFAGANGAVLWNVTQTTATLLTYFRGQITSYQGQQVVVLSDNQRWTVRDLLIGTLLATHPFPFNTTGYFSTDVQVAGNGGLFLVRSDQSQQHRQQDAGSVHFVDLLTGVPRVIPLSPFAGGMQLRSAAVDNSREVPSLYLSVGLRNQMSLSNVTTCSLVRVNIATADVGSLELVWTVPFNCSGDFNTFFAASRDGKSYYITADINDDQNDSQFINVTKMSKATGAFEWTQGPYLSTYDFTHGWYEMNTFTSPQEMASGALVFTRLKGMLVLNATTGAEIGKGPQGQGGASGQLVLGDDGKVVVGATSYNGSFSFLCGFTVEV